MIGSHGLMWTHRTNAIQIASQYNKWTEPIKNRNWLEAGQVAMYKPNWNSGLPDFEFGARKRHASSSGGKTSINILSVCKTTQL